MTNLNVSLTDELKDFIDEKVHGGFYGTASEVVRDGLRLLKQRDLQEELDRLRQKVALGFEQSERGQLVSGDEAFAKLQERSRRRRAERQ